MKPISQFLNDIQQAKITWIATRDDPTLFEAVFNGEHVQLRMNDFPDEPIYTLFVRDKAIDIEEGPQVWHLDHRS
jgi:hypothetical protein